MEVRYTLSRETIHKLPFPMGAVVLTADNGTQIVCADFHHSRKRKVELFVWNPSEKKWVKTYAKNELTETMWDYHRKVQRKHRNTSINYERLMAHERKRKHSSGGSRIYNGSITDYECSKNPLHDFKRCYN